MLLHDPEHLRPDRSGPRSLLAVNVPRDIRLRKVRLPCGPFKDDASGNLAWKKLAAGEGHETVFAVATSGSNEVVAVALSTASWTLMAAC